MTESRRGRPRGNDLRTIGDAVGIGTIENDDAVGIAIGHRQQVERAVEVEAAYPA